jgi:hypothetical protein
MLINSTMSSYYDRDSLIVQVCRVDKGSMELGWIRLVCHAKCKQYNDTNFMSAWYVLSLSIFEVCELSYRCWIYILLENVFNTDCVQLQLGWGWRWRAGEDEKKIIVLTLTWRQRDAICSRSRHVRKSTTAQRLHTSDIINQSITFSYVTDRKDSASTRPGVYTLQLSACPFTNGSRNRVGRTKDSEHIHRTRLNFTSD